MATLKMATIKKKTTKKAPNARAGNTQEDAKHRRKVFAEAYLTNGGNASEAARAAGYSHKTSHAAGSRLLKDVDVLTIIKQRRKVVIEKIELTTERTLREIARVAYSDPRKLFNADGTLKQIHELDDDAAATIASVDMEEIKEQGIVIGMTRKVKQWDKNAALEKAMKHLGLYEKDNEQQNMLDGVPRDLVKALVEKLGKLKVNGIG